MTDNETRIRFPQIKICGLTDPAQAAACAELGADAIGLVFHPASPRHLSLERAARITAALPGDITAVGVFVDPSAELLFETVVQCRLGAVQLHGVETQTLIDGLRERCAVQVIKVLFASKPPHMEAADRYHGVAGYLLECGRGALPGGNARTWAWGAAAPFACKYPTVLAGGLTPDNIGLAIGQALPDAVDVSSGVEAAPGIKDLRTVARFIAAVKQTASLYRDQTVRPRPIFPTRAHPQTGNLLDIGVR